MKAHAAQSYSTSQWTHWQFAFMALIVMCLCGCLSPTASEEPTRALRRTDPSDAAVPKGQKKVALVIGNDNYDKVPLRNPANDADDIGKALQELGFIVYKKINANHREMEEAVEEFTRAIQNGDVGVFYFSGHGVQVSGENYLVPVGGSIKSETDVRHKTVNAGYILGKMEESKNRTNIFILDACRNNPFKGTRAMSSGLTAMSASVGTFIAYATAPGSEAQDGTGRNSPYARHLIQALKPEGLKIEDVFKRVLVAVDRETGGKQVPWIASSLREDFYFNPDDHSPHESTQGGCPPVSGTFPAYKERAALLSRRSGCGDDSAKEELDRMCKDPEAVRSFREAAEGGDDVAQFMLGRKLGLGLEVPKDYDEAMKWYRKSADKGNAIAQYNVGEMYNHGIGVAKDCQKALLWYEKAAKRGITLAQLRLGEMCEKGKGVPKDCEEAAKWYRRAAEDGDANAQCNLGEMYEVGKGVAKDYREAVRWFKEAAKQGHPRAQCNLGLMYELGKGVAKDLEQATEWYKKAAEKEYPRAQCCLCTMHIEGRGVAKDEAEAMKWCKKAAAAEGCPKARHHLRLMSHDGELNHSMDSN